MGVAPVVAEALGLGRLLVIRQRCHLRQAIQRRAVLHEVTDCERSGAGQSCGPGRVQYTVTRAGWLWATHLKSWFVGG